MKSYSIPENEIKILENIIKIDYEIYKKYIELGNSEIFNKSDDYKANIKSIKSLVKTEQDLLSKLKLNFYKSLAFIATIHAAIPDTIEVDSFEKLLNGEEKHIALLRTLSFFNLDLYAHREYIDTIVPRDIVELINKKLTNNKYKKSLLLFIIKLRRVFEKDINFGLYYLLDSYNGRNSIENQSLVRFKYLFVFSNIDLENELLDVNFQIGDGFYSYFKMFTDYFKIDSELSDELKSDYATDKIDEQINEILSVDNTQYKNGFNLSSTVRQLLLRSSLLLISDKKIMDINDEFHEFIESEEYRKEEFDNSISEESIINCFRKVNKDKERQKTLSLI